MASNTRLLGALLDNARLRKGLSVAQVARQSGVPLSVALKILAGDSRRPSWAAIVRLARTLDLPLSQVESTADDEMEPASADMVGA